MFDLINNYYCSDPESGVEAYATDGFPLERCKTLIMKSAFQR